MRACRGSHSLSHGGWSRGRLVQAPWLAPHCESPNWLVRQRAGWGCFSATSSQEQRRRGWTPERTPSFIEIHSRSKIPIPQSHVHVVLPPTQPELWTWILPKRQLGDALSRFLLIFRYSDIHWPSSAPSLPSGVDSTRCVLLSSPCCCSRCWPNRLRPRRPPPVCSTVSPYVRLPRETRFLRVEEGFRPWPVAHSANMTPASHPDPAVGRPRRSLPRTPPNAGDRPKAR